MKKIAKRFLAMVIALVMIVAMCVPAFAYTALEDDGNRDSAKEGSMHVVYTNSGMLRVNDEGTTVNLSADMQKVDVTITTSSSVTWGKVTKLALIEKEAADDEKEAAAEQVIFDDNSFAKNASKSRVIHYSIPVTEIGMRVPVCVYMWTQRDKEVDEWVEEWNTYNGQSYFTVLFTEDLYNQLVAAEAAATDEGVKASLEAAITKAKAVLEIKDPTPLTITNNVSMFKPETASIVEKDDAYVLSLTLNSASYDAVYVGYASEATAEASIPITIADGKGSVDIPLASVTEPIVLAFHGSKYYNRTATIDLAAKTLTFDPTEIVFDQFDGMTTEEAVGHAVDFATVDMVNQLIEAIQVQVRDENTDKYCAIAKAYYDALSDKDKAKLEDPGYFGDDTGDASKDDPRNQDGIGAKELLVVSFGTSFNDNRADTVKAVEDALVSAYPEYAVRRAFTAQIIINHIQSRDNEVIDNMQQALDRAVANGVKELVVQPTHLMHGAEYDEMCAALKAYEGKIGKITISEPLLNTDADKQAVAKAIVAKTADAAGFADVETAVANKDTAFVFMGHGTEHAANVTYNEMQKIMTDLGYANCFVGTVEGKPAETEVNAVLAKVQAAGFSKVVLRPLMVVAGDHANNDMAGDDEDSWKSIFGAALGAENVICQVNGLGEIPEVQQLYIAHVKEVLPAAQEITPTKTPDKTPTKTPSKTTSKTLKASSIKKISPTKKAIKYAKLKKKNQTFKIKVTKKTGDGKITFKKASGNKKIAVSKAGKVTVKKGLKKGTYKVKVKISMAKSKKYKNSSVTKTIKVVVK